MFTRLLMFTTFYSCMFTYNYPCLLVFTYVYTCLLMFTAVYSCLPMSTLVYRCLPMFTAVYSCLPMFTHVELWLLVITYVFPLFKGYVPCIFGVFCLLTQNDFMIIQIMCTYSCCPKKIIHWDMSLQSCPFFASCHVTSCRWVWQNVKMYR